MAYLSGIVRACRKAKVPGLFLAVAGQQGGGGGDVEGGYFHLAIAMGIEIFQTIVHFSSENHIK